MLLDWTYFWKPLLIIAMVFYLATILGRFWRTAFRERERIYAADPRALAAQRRIVVPVPHATDRSDPLYLQYRAFFYPRFLRMTAKSVAGWAVIVLLALD